MDFLDKDVLVKHCGSYGRYEFIYSTSSPNSIYLMRRLNLVWHRTAAMKF